MKITVVAIMMLPVVLFATVTDVELFYEQHQYEQAIAEAKKSTSFYGSLQLHLLWAKSAEALGRTEEAISAYERVLMISSHHKEARIALARLYANSDRVVLVKQLLEDDSLSKEDRTTITALISEDDNLVNISAKIGVGYDSNINVSPGDLDLPASSEEIGSRFIRFQGALNRSYQFENIENIYLRTNVAISYQSNEKNYYNLFSGLASLGIGYLDDNYDLFLPLIYSRLHYLGSDLMESIGIKPNANIALSSSLVGNINARYEERSYFQETDKKRDDSVVGAGLSVYHLFGDNIAYLKVNYDSYSPKYPDLIPYVEKKTISISTGIDYQINDTYLAGADLVYRYTDFDDPIAQNEDERSDKYYKIDLKLNRNILEDLVGSFNYTFASNRSNYLPSEYRKHIIMCNVHYKY